MKIAEITIAGTKYPIVFNLQTMLSYEEVSGASFFAGTDTLKARIALIIAAALSADEKTTLTVEKITGAGDLAAVREITAAYKAVNELAAEFFELPAVEKQAEIPAAAEEDKGKN